MCVEGVYDVCSWGTREKAASAKAHLCGSDGNPGALGFGGAGLKSHYLEDRGQKDSTSRQANLSSLLDISQDKGTKRAKCGSTCL